MGRTNEQNLQLQRQEEREHAAPIVTTATTTTTTTTTTTAAEQVMGLMQQERVEQMATTTTQRPLQVAQQLRQNRMRHAPIIERRPVVAAAPVQDPYAGMSRVKRHFAEKKEKNRIEKNRSTAKKAQQKAAKLLGRQPEDIAPDMLALLQRGQKFQNMKQEPFDLQQASMMQLDLDCLAEQDYVNEGMTIGIETILQQMRTLDQIAQVREEQRPVWEQMDAKTRARCQTLLDQRDAYKECVKNILTLHNLKLDEDGKLNALRIGGKEQQRQDAESALEILRVRQLMSNATAADYEAGPQRVYTQEDKQAFMAAERTDYQQRFGDDRPLVNLSENELEDRVHGCQRTTGEYGKRVHDWSAQYTAFLNRPGHVQQWDKKHLKLGALERDAMIAIGAQGMVDFEQATEEERQQHFAEAERLMISVTQLRQLEKRADAIPGLSIEQAVDNVCDIFALCFDRFQTSFEETRRRLQTAFTPEGKLVELQELGRYYGWWQALKEIYAQSPLLMARIPLEQMAYARSIAIQIMNGHTDIKRMIAEQKEGNVLPRDHSMKDPEEYARLNSAARLEVERSVKAEHMTENHPLRERVEQYAAKTGVSLDTALHILREAGYQEDFAEQFRTTGRQIDMKNLSLRERFTLLNFSQKDKEILKESDARMQSVKALLRTRYSEEDVEAMTSATVSIKGTLISGLVLDRFIISLPVMQPDITDEEIARLFEENYRVNQYTLVQNMRQDLKKDADAAAVGVMLASQANMHAGLRDVLTNGQMRQLMDYDQQVIDRLKAQLASAEVQALQPAEHYIKDLTDEQRTALQTYEADMQKLLQQTIDRRRDDPISLLTPGKQKTYRKRQAFLDSLTEETMQQINESDRYMREKLQGLLIGSLDTMQQKFGRYLSELHIMDILDLMGEEYFRYISITQDLMQMVEGMHEAGMLDEDTYTTLFEQADYWIKMSRIKYLQKELEGDPDGDDLPKVQHRLAEKTYNNPRQDGPRMTDEQREAYIQHVRLRYPDLLYGLFA